MRRPERRGRFQPGSIQGAAPWRTVTETWEEAENRAYDGLRPGRPSVRLQIEELDRARIVHDYGHGSVGVMLSWGCARDAVALLLQGTPPIRR